MDLTLKDQVMLNFATSSPASFFPSEAAATI
jgi:hypothetical protein